MVILFVAIRTPPPSNRAVRNPLRGCQKNRIDLDFSLKIGLPGRGFQTPYRGGRVRIAMNKNTNSGCCVVVGVWVWLWVWVGWVLFGGCLVFGGISVGLCVCFGAIWWYEKRFHF